MNVAYKFTVAVAAALSLVAAGCSSESIDDELTEVVEGTDDAEGTEENEGTEDENQVDNTRYDLELAEGEAEIVSGYNRQSIALLDKLTVDNTTNVYTSPMSLNILLSMFANGVTGEARTELLNYLGANSLPKLNTFNTKLMDELVKLDNQTTLHIANSLWATPGFSFLTSYRNQIDSSYHGSFYDDVTLSTQQGKDAINQWCSEKTEGLIPEFLEQPLDPATQYFLVNALYFKGKWTGKFDKDLASIRPFSAADGTQAYAHYMEGTKTLKTVEKDGTRILEIPFGNMAFVLDILLPAEGTAVKSLLADTHIISMLDEISEARVSVRLPKFKIEYKHDNLVNVLKGIGLTKLFDDADFSEMTSAAIRKVDVIKQKNVFEIDETGAEAATVTGGGVVTAPGQSEIQIISFDRPFMFIVRESSTGLFVSLGVVNKI